MDRMGWERRGKVSNSFGFQGICGYEVELVGSDLPTKGIRREISRGWRW